MSVTAQERAQLEADFGQRQVREATEWFPDANGRAQVPALFTAASLRALLAVWFS